MSVQYQSMRQFFNGCLYETLAFANAYYQVYYLHDFKASCLFVSFSQDRVITVCFSDLPIRSHHSDLNGKCTGTTQRTKSRSTWMPYLSRVQWVFRTHMFLWPHHRAWSDQSCCVSGKWSSKVSTMTNHHWRTTVFAVNGYPLTNKKTNKQTNLVRLKSS